LGKHWLEILYEGISPFELLGTKNPGHDVRVLGHGLMGLVHEGKESVPRLHQTLYLLRLERN